MEKPGFFGARLRLMVYLLSETRFVYPCWYSRLQVYEVQPRNPELGLARGHGN